MAATQQNFYEVLGVRRGAELSELTRAYARFVAEMRKESTAPNAPLEALMKIAYETLADPARRAEYDASLKRPAPPAPPPPVARRSTARANPAPWIAAVVVVLVAAAGYWLMTTSFARKPANAAKSMETSALLATVAPLVGTASGAMMSGEVRDLGIAIATGEDEMAIPCPGLNAGMALTVNAAGANLRAQVANARDDLLVCMLTVGGVHGGMKVRPTLPGPQDALQAIVFAEGMPQARPVTVARSLPDPHGPAFAIKSAIALPNGTPLFDAQSQLAGIVVTPHGFGEGVVAVLGAGRLQQARKAAPAQALATGATPASPADAASAQPPAEPATPTPRASGRGIGTKTGEGFTTLWKEREDGNTVEVLDSAKHGSIGLPIQYWTTWAGRGTGDRQIHCLVTYGDDREVVADFDETASDTPADGYRTCSLTRFQVNLDDLDAGEYHFTIFVDGKAVSEGSIRLERRIVTPFRMIVVVLVIGLLLLRWIRRRRES